MSDTEAKEPAIGAPDPKLLEILVCPTTKGPLTYDAARQELVSPRARLAYPIRDGVPQLTERAARQLDQDTKRDAPADPS